MAKASSPNYRLPLELRDAIAAIADFEGRSITNMLERIVREWFQARSSGYVGAMPAVPARTGAGGAWWSRDGSIGTAPGSEGRPTAREMRVAAAEPL